MNRHADSRFEIAHGVVFIKYCSILLQALTIEADEDFLFSVYDLTKIEGASWDSGETEYVLPKAFCTFISNIR
jgi:vacuolar protein sorting-associated protein 13A/C